MAEEDRHEKWLQKRQEALRNLSQEDRDFIAKYGIEMWKKKEIQESELADAKEKRQYEENFYEKYQTIWDLYRLGTEENEALLGECQELRTQLDEKEAFIEEAKQGHISEITRDIIGDFLDQIKKIYGLTIGIEEGTNKLRLVEPNIFTENGLDLMSDIFRYLQNPQQKHVIVDFTRKPDKKWRILIRACAE